MQSASVGSAERESRRSPATALVDKLHLCDIKPDRLAELKARYRPATATLDYQDIIKNDNISVVFISTTPESNHYPIARDCLRAGKNVMLEKPIALELWEADELIMLAKRNNLKFTIGYSQRFNTEDRLRQEEDHRRHARQGGVRPGEPASVARLSARRSPAACGSRRW